MHFTKYLFMYKHHPYAVALPLEREIPSVMWQKHLNCVGTSQSSQEQLCSVASDI